MENQHVAGQSVDKKEPSLSAVTHPIMSTSSSKFHIIIVDLKRKEGEDFKCLEGEGVPGTLDVGISHVPVTQKCRFH